MRMRYLILFCLLSLTGCQRGNALDASVPTVEASAPDANVNTFMASSRGINYDHEFGIDYTLRWADGAQGEAIGSGSVGPFEDSGQNCCVSLPKQWHPGLKLKVEWVALDLSTRKSNEWKTENLQTELAVPEYKAPGDLYVLFYPGKQVEILVSASEPGMPGWVGREKQGPVEACVTKHGEKECMKSFPKYPRNSFEARAQLFRESCTEERVAESSDPEGNRQACQEFVKMCKEKWEIKEKKMCDLNFKEEE
ncbi:DUF3304 domain-containing protein [Chitiniphilus eburneus]|uniref:DUF3304 domain-containing protein n=1 Tax=Chitiniphilus eburneus TaxID=2571148 RepID=A0A4U0PP24_9NEIS|nr:DUF3304 domain-containing protein [Chitiniphilus eburneus]TJZ64744.1 DUF3304 domain-containing protein [Chitiniphilus eburneus]